MSAPDRASAAGRVHDSADSRGNGPFEPDPADSEPGSVEMRTRGWAVVIPVKPPEAGKSRLEAPVADRLALARSIALDTIGAAAACAEVAQVYVVTSDASLPVHAHDIPGLRFVPEEGAHGLNAAIAAGMAAVGERMPRAALLGDLPSLRPDELGAALRLAASVDRGVVADAEGTGSTLLTARAGVRWESAFGNDSLARHRALGAQTLAVPAGSTLRRDVDTVDQLLAAAALGVGPRTAVLVCEVAEHAPDAAQKSR